MRPPRMVSRVSSEAIVSMNPAEKGERYARIFRKAGTFLSKGNIARAVEVLKEGVDVAKGYDDEKMMGRFQDEIARVQQSPENGEGPDGITQ